MRELDTSVIKDSVRNLCIDANIFLPGFVAKKIDDAFKDEENPLAREILLELYENRKVAAETGIPICQDTGMAVVFLEIGQDVHLVGEYLEDAVNAGVAQGYRDGCLRFSVVRDPLKRVNTDNNTPAIIHTKIVPGDKVKITVSPKGFGSENMSAVRMFTPSAHEEDIIKFVCETVKSAGGNPCPPITVGVGIGGNFEYCAYLAKKALIREMDNADGFYANLENKILAEINALDIGPQGMGGSTTALYVHIEQYPTHIAGLPVAVNIGCHVTRHREIVV